VVSDGDLRNPAGKVLEGEFITSSPTHNHILCWERNWERERCL